MWIVREEARLGCLWGFLKPHGYCLTTYHLHDSSFHETFLIFGGSFTVKTWRRLCDWEMTLDLTPCLVLSGYAMPDHWLDSCCLLFLNCYCPLIGLQRLQVMPPKLYSVWTKAMGTVTWSKFQDAGSCLLVKMAPGHFPFMPTEQVMDVD